MRHVVRQQGALGGDHRVDEASALLQQLLDAGERRTTPRLS